MADEPVIPAVSSAPAPTETVAAPVAATTVAPVESSSPQPSPVQTETKQPELPLVTPTVLGADEASKTETVPEVKVEEVKPEVKAEEVKPEVKVDTNESEVKAEDKVEEKIDEVKTLPIFEPWKFPEGVTTDETRIADFNKELGEFALEAKIEPKLLQGLGQKLVDRHISEIQEVATKVAAAYDKVWKDQTKAWFDDFAKDPEIGGNRMDTTVSAAREFIRRHGGTAEEQAEIRSFMEKTGVGNYKGLIRLFAKANSSLGEGKLVPASTPPAESSTRKQRFYGKKA